MNLDTDEEVGGAGTPNEDAQPSLRETLQAEFAKATGGEDDAPAAPARTRDEGGRFAARAAAAAPDDGAAPAPAPAPAAVEPAAAAPDPSAAAPAPAVDIPAPHSWNNEAKAKWSDVPPEVRKYIAEREDQVHRAMTRSDEERNLGRTMSQALQPHMETMRAVGVAPDQAVAGLLNVDAVLRKGTPEQKLEMVHEIMRSYQIQPEAVFNHQPMPQDPRLNALQQQLQAVQQQLVQGTQHQQEAFEQRAAQAEIDAFKAKAPHLEAVKADMAQLLTNGLAANLQDAYDKAVWANPQTRQAMLDAQVAAATASATRTQRVASARNAGSSISGAPGGVVPNPPAQKRSLREELAANLSAAQSRI